MASDAVFSIAHIPVGEYLGSVYRPDVDYVDGVIEERNVGEYDHADLQRAVLLALIAQEKPSGVKALQELRVQVAATRFRVPDVCLLPANLRTQIIREAPLLCVEVLSPRDNILRMRHRCEDYLRMGVPAVWIFDPQARVAYVLTTAEMTEHREGILRLPNSPIELDILSIFSVLED
jgi:Uma2 family endonuclease